jgi:salicylate hydroxylase
MAVEDGVLLGDLLGWLVRDFSPSTAQSKISAILKFYETLRKPRTTLSTQGAVLNRMMNHLHDGPEQLRRDADLKNHMSPNPWKFADGPYQKALLGLDIFKDCEDKYITWRQDQQD